MLNALAISSVFVVYLLFIDRFAQTFNVVFSSNNFIYSFPCVSDVRLIFREGGRKIMLYGCTYASL